MNKMRTDYFEIDSNNNMLRGLCHIPSAKNDEAVLIIHGYFSSNKIGPHRLYVKIADRLAQSGYYAYRFDLSGMGESDGLIENIDFCDHVNDIKNVVRYISKKHSCNKVKIIAHCIGASLVLSLLTELSELFSNVIFIAPFFSNEDIMRKFFTEESITDLKVKNFTYRKGLYVSGSFFDNNSSEELFIQKLRKVKIALTVILAPRDELIPLEYSVKLFDCKNIKQIVIPKAGHNFLNTQQQLLAKIVEVIL